MGIINLLDEKDDFASTKHDVMRRMINNENKTLLNGDDIIFNPIMLFQQVYLFDCQNLGIPKYLFYTTLLYFSHNLTYLTLRPHVSNIGKLKLSKNTGTRKSKIQNYFGNNTIGKWQPYKYNI